MRLMNADRGPSKCGRCARPPGACRKEEGRMKPIPVVGCGGKPPRAPRPQRAAIAGAWGRAKSRPRKGAVEWGNVRLCSLMVAYVRFIGEKCLRACADSFL